MSDYAPIISRRNGEGELRVHIKQLKLTFEERVVRHIPIDPLELLEGIAAEVGTPYETEDAIFVTSRMVRGLRPSLPMDDLRLTIYPKPPAPGSEVMVVSWKAVVRGLFRKHPELKRSYSEKQILSKASKRDRRPTQPVLS